MFQKKETEYVKKRKSYYGFAKNYPGKLGSSKYVIGESKIVKRREFIRSIIIVLLAILLFTVSYVATSVCLNISDKPIENKISILQYDTKMQKTFRPEYFYSGRIFKTNKKSNCWLKIYDYQRQN